MFEIYETYIWTTLIISAIWIYHGRYLSLQQLSLTMFFPGLFAPWFNQDPHFLMQLMGIMNVKNAVMYSINGLLFAFVVVWMVYSLTTMSGWAKPVSNKRWCRVQFSLNKHLVSLLRAAGEEIGWRCFLLPQLMAYHSPVKAFLISGMVCGLYHVPIMLLFTHRFDTKQPWLTVAIRVLKFVLSAFPLGWLAAKSGYSLWPSTILSCIWNHLNVYVMGNIYEQSTGLVQGKPWIINGDGVAGCLILVPVAFLLLYNV